MLTVKQNQFLNEAYEGKNIFLTGKAGTGKSYIVNEMIALLKSEGRKVIACAPTGIAAINIKGQTIHSLFGLNPFGVLDYDTCNFLKSKKRDVLRKADVIVIDEVSMLRPDILDAMHLTMKKNGLEGITAKQIIFVGDMKQLPPVVNDNTRSVMMQTYDDITFEYSKVYDKLNVVNIELDEVLRQSDPQFIEALNAVREGGKHQYFRQFVKNTPCDGIILAPHISTVKKYNEAGLRSLSTELQTFKAIIQGEINTADFNLESLLELKNGAKVMHLVNSENNPLVNGTIGTFVSHKGCHYIRVNGTDFSLEPVTISKKEYIYNPKTDQIELQELGSITQLPVKLAYALTIHKSQGLTFDKVTIDLTRPCFAKGQMYVALSRVRTPQGLTIIH
jgi:ATP-dependent DNA helicase PIF1